MVTSLSSQLVRLIDRKRIAHLATADTDSAPHVVPICFALYGDTLYSVIDRKPKRAAATELRRVRNIIDNPRVSVLMDHYEEDWSRLWYVLIRGTASILHEGPEHARAIELLLRKYAQYARMDIEDRPIIKVETAGVVVWGSPPETRTT